MTALLLAVLAAAPQLNPPLADALEKAHARGFRAADARTPVAELPFEKHPMAKALGDAPAPSSICVTTLARRRNKKLEAEVGAEQWTFASADDAKAAAAALKSARGAREPELVWLKSPHVVLTDGAALYVVRTRAVMWERELDKVAKDLQAALPKP